jgi:hypothetical protein
MKDRFIEFLTNEFSRTKSVGAAYKNDTEMINHFLSGEVTMPVTRMMEFFDSKEFASDHTWLPSRFGHNEAVRLDFGDSGHVDGCKIAKIHFTESKVLYDVTITALNTRLYNVDSCFVLPILNEKKCVKSGGQLLPDNVNTREEYIEYILTIHQISMAEVIALNTVE